MPKVKDRNGEPVDLTFERDDERLIATFGWEVGHSYQLEFDSRKINATSVVVRLPYPRVPAGDEELMDGHNSLVVRQDPTTDTWSPAPCTSQTITHTAGQNRIYEVQSGWGTFPLRLSFTPGPSDRWFEVRQGGKVA